MKSLILFILLCISATCAAQQPQPSPNAVAIPTGGNTFITRRDGASSERIRNGIERWSNPSTIYSTFFRISKPGNMLLFMNYNASSNSEIMVTCGNSTFQVTLTKGTYQVAYIGMVAQADSGYVRVDMQGVKREGDEFAQVGALLVDGEPTTGAMSFVGSDFSFHFGRRGPSVHLSYPFPDNETVEWFYSEITVPLGEDPVGTFYMANGFAEGYFGIQVNSMSERRVLFSVWSPYQTDNPRDIPEDERIKMLKKGEDVYTGEFGNEGSGGQSYLKYMWITGNTYRFLTRIRPNGLGDTEYTAYFFAPELGQWRLIAQFLRPKTNTWYRRAHSFLESFNPELGYVGRKALYGNQWARSVDGRWTELTTARFTADETARKQMRMDYKGGTMDGMFFLQNCGFINDYTIMGSNFARPKTGVEPVIDWEGLE